MLAIKRPNLIKYNNLPIEIWNKIEKLAEINFIILVTNIRQFCTKVSLVNIFTKNKFKEIILDDVLSYDDTINDEIKLSSDGNFLVYLDIDYNMVYYDINSTSENKRKINITKNKIIPLKVFFDRNGYYYCVSNSNETNIFSLKNETYLFSLPVSSISNISDDYNRIFGRINDQAKLYDLNNGNIIYSFELNHLYFASINSFGDYIIYDSYDEPIKILNTSNNNIIEYSGYRNDIVYFASNNKLIALHFMDYIYVHNLNTNKNYKIECDCNPFYCEIDFHYNNGYTYLVIRNDEESIIVHKIT
jgi:hypothetical protein